MPRTVALSASLLNNLFTNERLLSYSSVFSPADDFELVGAYLWNARVCGALHPILGAAEIGLRNAIDDAISNSSTGRFWWSSSKLQWKSRQSGSTPQVVNKLRDNFSKAANQVVREKRERYQLTGTIVPTHGEIISKTDFSTWEFMLDDEFMGRGLFWNQHLSAVFRGNWGGRRPGLLLGQTRNLVRAVRSFRNRVSHHEPAWKKAGIFNAEDALRHLWLKLTQVVELVELVEPLHLDILRKNGLLGEAERACSEAELRRYQLLAKDRTIRSARGFSVAMKECDALNSSIYVRRTGGSPRFLLTPST